MIAVASRSASSMDCDARSPSGRTASGRNRELRCLSLISSASPSSRAQMTVGVLLATSPATVVPQEPAPSTATLAHMATTLFLGMGHGMGHSVQPPGTRLPTTGRRRVSESAQPLERRGDALAAPDAHRDQRAVGVGPTHLVERLD